MKILATLLVGNEADLVADCLTHHLEQGVDAFLVTEHASSDGTREILESFRDVIVDLRHESDPAYRQDRWVTRMAQRAVHFQPGWIMHLDADERWYGLDLLRGVADEFDWVQTGPWRNHLPVTRAVDSPFDRGMMPYFEIAGKTGRWASRFVEFGAGDGRKVIHRPLPDVEVGIGNHRLHRPDTPAFCCDGIEVHHYPVRSWEQFRAKVIRGAKAVDEQEWQTGVAGHWRSWRDMETEGQLERVFDRILLSDSEIDQRLADGTLFLHSS